MADYATHHFTAASRYTVSVDYDRRLYAHDIEASIAHARMLGRQGIVSEADAGAIVGGLIIGVGEKIAEIYWGPAFGGAIEGWFAYMLALAFLMFRPQGLFGEKIIERV